MLHLLILNNDKFNSWQSTGVSLQQIKLTDSSLALKISHLASTSAGQPLRALEDAAPTSRVQR